MPDSDKPGSSSSSPNPSASHSPVINPARKASAPILSTFPSSSYRKQNVSSPLIAAHNGTRLSSRKSTPSPTPSSSRSNSFNRSILKDGHHSSQKLAANASTSSQHFSLPPQLNHSQSADYFSAKNNRKGFNISPSVTPFTDSEISRNHSSNSTHSFHSDSIYLQGSAQSSSQKRLPLGLPTNPQRYLVSQTSEFAINPDISNSQKYNQSQSDQESESSSDGIDNEDLKFATKHNENLVLELSLDGLIRYVSSNWESVVGYVIFLFLIVFYFT